MDRENPTTLAADMTPQSSITMPCLPTELRDQLGPQKLEQAINLSAVALAKVEVNVPARRSLGGGGSVQRVGGRGLGYGG